VFAISVPSLAVVVILGLVAVAAIAWLLSPRDLTIDVEGLADERANRRSP
jgi:hypothetical protein